MARRKTEPARSLRRTLQLLPGAERDVLHLDQTQSAPLRLRADWTASSPRRLALKPPRRDGLNSSCLWFYLLTRCAGNTLSTRWLENLYFLLFFFKFQYATDAQSHCSPEYLWNICSSITFYLFPERERFTLHAIHCICYAKSSRIVHY